MPLVQADSRHTGAREISAGPLNTEMEAIKLSLIDYSTDIHPDNKPRAAAHRKTHG